MLRGPCPEALSGFVKFHPQYPVLKVPGGASRPPCASRSRLARGCILRTSPPRVKGKFGFGRNYSGARADSAESSVFPQVAQSLPAGPCRPSLWRGLHNQGGERGDARGQRALVAAGHERHAAARDPGAVASATAKTAISANADWPFAPPYARQSRHRILTNSATARGPAPDPSRSGSFGRSRPWATAWSGS